MRRKKHVYSAARKSKEESNSIINAIKEISKALEGANSKISGAEKELTYMQSTS